MKLTRDATPSERYEYGRKYRKAHRKEISRGKRLYYERLKILCIEAYGGKCTCCGEAHIEFLTLEHKGGRGDKDKHKSGANKTGWSMYQRARAEGWPDRFTILCFNCNCAKGVFGTCPHKKGGTKITDVKVQKILEKERRRLSRLLRNTEKHCEICGVKFRPNQQVHQRTCSRSCTGKLVFQIRKTRGNWIGDS